MEFTITKEQVKEIYQNYLRNQDYLASKSLKEWFPEAFKTELEIGKWYYNEKYNVVVYLAELKYDNVFDGYGFNKDKEWFGLKEFGVIYAEYCNREATHEEVESALIAEAKRRGYKADVTVLPLFSDGRPHGNTSNCGLTRISDNNFVFDERQNSLDFNNSSVRLFCKGQWAEIIPTEKTVITREKALSQRKNGILKSLD